MTKARENVHIIQYNEANDVPRQTQKSQADRHRRALRKVLSRNKQVKAGIHKKLITRKQQKVSYYQTVISLFYLVREFILTRRFTRAAGVIAILLRIKGYEDHFTVTYEGKSYTKQHKDIQGICLQLGWVIIFQFFQLTVQQKLKYALICGRSSKNHVRRFALSNRPKIYLSKDAFNDLEYVRKQQELAKGFYGMATSDIHSDYGVRRQTGFQPAEIKNHQPSMYWSFGTWFHFDWLQHIGDFRTDPYQAITKLEQDPEAINSTQSTPQLAQMYVDAVLNLSKCTKLLPDFPLCTFLQMHAYITMGEYDKATNAVTYACQANPLGVDALVLYILTIRSVSRRNFLTPIEWAKMYLKVLKIDPLSLAALRDLHLQFVDGDVPIAMLVEGFFTHLDICTSCRKLGLNDETYEDDDELVCPSNAWQYLSECLAQAAEQALLYLPESVEDWVEQHKEKVRMEVDVEADEETSMWKQWLHISQMIQDRAYWWENTHFQVSELPSIVKFEEQGQDLCYRAICSCYLMGPDHKYVKRMNKLFKKYNELESFREDLKRNRFFCHHVVNTYNEVQDRRFNRKYEGQLDVVQPQRKLFKERYGVLQIGSVVEEEERTNEGGQKMPQEWWNLFPFKRKRVA